MSRPWFPFYVGDYVRDTARLTTEAHGAYLLLMLDYWVNGAPPDDDDVLATITKLPVTIWRKRRPTLSKFFKIKDGIWTHSRIDKEKAKAEEVGTANSDKARDAANRRWAKEQERKLMEQSEQCAGDATSINGALLHNAQSQPQSPSTSESDSKKRESNSLPDLKLVDEGKPIPIDADYQPSDRAIEYAYSLGMKKADLKSELSKFVALSMASKAKSYNPDMSFKAWCDRWLDFKRQKNPDWMPDAAAPSDASVYTDRLDWQIVVEGTNEHTCWNIVNREQGLRPLFLCKQLGKDGTVYERAAKCPTLFPPGFNDFGERIAPQQDEDAA